MQQTATMRVLPAPARLADSARFWEEASKSKFLLPRCTRCKEFHWYPRAHCPLCFHNEIQWQEASGRGSIYSYSVMRTASPPYAIAYVALEEGVTMLTNIVACNLDKLHIGQEVQLVFQPAEDDTPIPCFTVTSGEGRKL